MCFCKHSIRCGLPGHFHEKWEWIPTDLNAGIKSSLPIIRPASPPFPPLPFHPCQECKQLQSIKNPFSAQPFLLQLFSLIQTPPPPPPHTPSPLLYFPCLLQCFGWRSRSSVLKLWMDIWAVGFSGSNCPGLSPVIGSAWLINGGHCRWTPFSTDRHYLLEHFISPFPQMDHISLCIVAYTDKIKMLLYLHVPFHCLYFKDSLWLPLLCGLLFSANLTWGKMSSLLRW